MKLLKLLTAVIFVAATVTAQDVMINETNFPDENFRNFLLTSYNIVDQLSGSVSGGKFTPQQIAKIKNISVNGENISNLKGIEFFTNLENLLCSNNLLTSLDVSKNTKLVWLNCGDNQLTSLDVSKNTELEFLVCGENPLGSLDVSKNIELNHLTCYANQLTSIDVSKNTKLERFYCNDNQLTSIDVSKNTRIYDFACGYNQLTSVDVSKNTKLRYLGCENNKLTSLDLSKNKELGYLYCNNNLISELDVSNNTEIRTLYCSYNQLHRIDLSRLTNLLEEPIVLSSRTIYGFVGDNQTVPLTLTLQNNSQNYGVEIDLEQPTNLIDGVSYIQDYCLSPEDCGGTLISESNTISSSPFTVETGNSGRNLSGTFIFNYEEEECPIIPINENTFPDDNFREWILAHRIGQDGVLDCHEILMTDTMRVRNMGIKTLKGIEYFTELLYLSCYDNELTSIDLSKNTKLDFLECRENQLTELDLSNNTNLVYLDVSENHLYNIDLSKLIDLRTFDGQYQTVPLTLENMDGYYGIEITLNNPTNLAEGIRYENGILISESRDISSSEFIVETKLDGKTLSGTFEFTYSNWSEWSDWITVKEPNCIETGLKIRTRVNLIDGTPETETEIIPQLTDCAEKSSGYLVLAKNIVSDKAEISVVIPESEVLSEVRIIILDAVGNMLFEQSSSICSPENPVVWDLSNKKKRQVSAGTYFVIAEVKTKEADGDENSYRYSAKLGVKKDK